MKLSLFWMSKQIKIKSKKSIKIWWINLNNSKCNRLTSAKYPPKPLGMKLKSKKIWVKSLAVILLIIQTISAILKIPTIRLIVRFNRQNPKSLIHNRILPIQITYLNLQLILSIRILTFQMIKAKTYLQER